MRVGAVLILLGVSACGRENFDPAINVAFVTSTTHLPLSFGADLAGADAICAERAAEAGYVGAFVAYLDRAGVPAADRLGNARGWHRTDGLPFADRPVDVAAGAFAFPLRLDEHGEDLGIDVRVASGEVDGFNEGDCAGYSSETARFRFGFVDASGDPFHDAGLQTCQAAVHLACFQTTFDQPLEVAPQSGRRAFLSVQSFLPDAGGLAGADALCAQEASLAGLSGTFVALLGTRRATAISRFDLAGPPWVRLDGVPLVNSPLDLAAGALLTSLDLTSAGTRVHAEVLTGSVQPGQLAGIDCEEWTSSAGLVQVGDSSRSGGDAWVSGAGQAASCTGPLYCFEQ